MLRHLKRRERRNLHQGRDTMSDTMTMTQTHGKFVWYELMTPDTKGAAKFYASILPWTAKETPMPGMNYSLFAVGATDVAGMMPMVDDAVARKIPPNWTGYVAVDDVDATAKQFKKEGGAIFREPTDIPGVGRFAVVADPLGAVLAIFKPSRSDAPAMPAPETPGLFGWRELHTTDQKAAMDFYGRIFGWGKGDAIDMGPMGTYQILKRRDEMFGGAFNSPAAAGHPFWLYYVNVPSIEAAKAKVEKSGGKITNGPMEVPGGAWIINCIDPQGAHFALVGGK
jgi:predicted enzyme related to lactoylglutathione lyase